jgi:hypothetical protein
LVWPDQHELLAIAKDYRALSPRSAAVSGKEPSLLAVAMTDGVGFWNLDTGRCRFGQ